jgi:hypothetical protein
VTALQNQLKAVFLLGAMSALLVGLGGLVAPSYLYLRALIKLERASEAIPVSGPTPATASLFIVNPLGAVETLSRLFATHPTTAERVRRLRAGPRELPRRPPSAAGVDPRPLAGGLPRALENRS